MATGDIRNNLKKLQKQISMIRYPDNIDFEGLTKGDVTAHLHLLYHAFFHFSPRVVESTAKLNYNIAGKKDVAFVNVVFKIMRELDPTCDITLKVGQFMSKGFAERKIIFTTSVLKFVRTSPKMAANKTTCKMRTKSGETAPGNDPGTPTRSRTQPARLPLAVRDGTPTRRRVRPAAQSMLSTAPQMHSTGRSILGACAAPVASSDLSAVESLHSVTDYLGTVAQKEIPIRQDPVGRDDGPPEQDDIYMLLIGVSDDLTRIKEELTSEREKTKASEEKLERKVTILETENLNLKTRVGSLEVDLETLKKEITDLKSVNQPQLDVTNIVARLDIHDMKLQGLENAENYPSSIHPAPHSPVCGDDLCSHMKKLQLPHDDSTTEVLQTTGDDASLLDTTNKESPYRQQIRQKGVKLLELVQGTRSLLGMSEDLEKFKLAGTGEKCEVENLPPE